MSDSKQRTAGNDAADVASEVAAEVAAEVELSADDLLEMSAAGASSEPPSVATTKPKAPTPRVVSIMDVLSAPAPAPRRTPAWRGAVSFALVLGAVGAVYLAIAPAKRAAEKAVMPQAQLPASAPKSEGAPVLFANPFDAREVFEFPAGTSEDEARDAVAEILMERAMERQRTFDARVSSNR